MWKCPKCGECLENQFDSCWKCAKPMDPAPHTSVERLTLRHYAFALLMSYLAPWLAAFFGSWWFPYPYSTPFKRLCWDAQPDILIWMLVPAWITFLALLPFLRYRLGRKAALVALCLIWLVLERPAMTKSYGFVQRSVAADAGRRLRLLSVAFGQARLHFALSDTYESGRHHLICLRHGQPDWGHRALGGHCCSRTGNYAFRPHASGRASPRSLAASSILGQSEVTFIFRGTCYVAAPQSRGRGWGRCLHSFRVALFRWMSTEHLSLNHRSQRTPRGRSVCIGRQWRGAAAAECYKS
jgi:hypothetical protein